MANEFKDINSLPDPLPTDAMAIVIRGDKLVLYIQSAGKMVGFFFDVIDGFNLSYLMLGATLQRLREMGKDMEAPVPEREAFETFLGDLEVDLEKPPELDKDEDDPGLFA